MNLVEKSRWVRQQSLEVAVRAGHGHLGGAFSCTDILVALYYGGLLRQGIDRFILSKGHACLPLYVILADLGYFPKEELGRFCQPGALLQGHPTRQIPGIEADTGFLGHGLGIGAGMALAGQLDGKEGYVYVLLGDGECYEGSVWEAAQFAGQYRLSNLIAIVDNNGLGVMGKVEKLGEEWRAFGWQLAHVDGHDIEAIKEMLCWVNTKRRRKPFVLVADTIKGKGVSFMENKIEWHHGVPKGEELEQARREFGHS